MPTELIPSSGLARRDRTQDIIAPKWGDEAAMKIVKFEHFHVECGWEIYSFLKISTDEGVTGWAEFRDHRRPGVGAAIHGMSEFLIGQDPRAINTIDATLYSFTR